MSANVRTKLPVVPERGTQSDERCNVPCFRTDVVARLRKSMPPPSELEAASRRFAMLSDPARIRIILALSDGEELCVCDVAHVLGTSISTASHHLRKLRDLGVLQFRNDGRMAYYSIRDQSIARLVASGLRQVRG